MGDKEKNENTDKFSISITEDGKQMLIFNDKVDELICRTSFYDDLSLSIEDKKQIGRAMLDEMFTIIANKEAHQVNHQWKEVCKYFKEAYAVEEKNKTANKTSVTWLMTTILGLSQEEAERRFDMADELMSHPDFKDKKSAIMDRIYLSNKHL